jgi:hypothetical protein
MTDYAELITKLRRWVACDDPFDTAQAAANAIESLRASLANEKEAREKADALATFFETEMTRILQEGQRK